MPDERHQWINYVIAIIAHITTYHSHFSHFYSGRSPNLASMHQLFICTGFKAQSNYAAA